MSGGSEKKKKPYLMLPETSIHFIIPHQANQPNELCVVLIVVERPLLTDGKTLGTEKEMQVQLR